MSIHDWLMKAVIYLPQWRHHPFHRMQLLPLQSVDFSPSLGINRTGRIIRDKRTFFLNVRGKRAWYHIFSYMATCLIRVTEASLNLKSITDLVSTKRKGKRKRKPPIDPNRPPNRTKKLTLRRDWQVVGNIPSAGCMRLVEVLSHPEEEEEEEAFRPRQFIRSWLQDHGSFSIAVYAYLTST